MSIRKVKSPDEFQRIAKALSLDVRMRIYELLHIKPHSLAEISEFLSLPLSSVTVNIQKLEDADLILCENVPEAQGMQKICSLKNDILIFSMRPDSELPLKTPLIPNTKEIKIPIGNYVSFEAESPCGVVADDNDVGTNDDIGTFYEPDHVKAQLIWLEKGYLEYNFPNETPEDAEIESLTFSAEMSSYTPGYNNDWPSDITVWINSVEIGTWTSPGDFGGIPGKLTPSWWPTTSSQFGLLKTWKIDEQGTYIDNEKISEISLKEIALMNKPFISVKIGVKPDAKHVGGLNIFGENFGNHQQDIVLHINYY